MNLRILARNVWTANVEKGKINLGMTPHTIGAIKNPWLTTKKPILVIPGTTVHLDQVSFFLHSFIAKLVFQYDLPKIWQTFDLVFIMKRSHIGLQRFFSL